MDPGKIFVGGISWETNEERLREYFETFGEVVEAVIMKDRNTGRARGFGFVIYADPLVAEIVVKQKHMIDGRAVEAKKAVPRDDQPIMNKSGNNSAHGSPGPIRTKKIFVGGLASTVTESDFKMYFDQFGNITDVVVMYDHNTQRPRGFGFITYDSEEAVDRVLTKTFHELNGKMVEVKRAVPKEMSPGPTRAQFGGNYGLHRVGSFLNGYNPTLVGALGVRMDEMHSPVSVGRSGFPLFGPTSYGTPLSNEMRMSPNNREAMNLLANRSYERGFNSLHGNGGNPKWNDNSAEYDGFERSNGSSFNTSWSLWGNGINTGANNPANSAGAFNRIEAIWGSSPLSSHTGGTNSPSSIRNLNYARGDVSIGFNHGNNVLPGSSFSAGNPGFEVNDLEELYGGAGDLSWLSSATEFNGSASFELGMGNAASEVPHKNPGLCW